MNKKTPAKARDAAPRRRPRHGRAARVADVEVELGRDAVAVRGATLDRSTLGGTEASFRFKTRDRPFQYLVRDWYTYGLESTQTSKLEGSKAPKYRNGPMSNGPMLLRHLTLGYLGRASVELLTSSHLPFVAALREGTSTKGEEG